jgi:Secretion system C-terminal sorting domain
MKHFYTLILLFWGLIIVAQPSIERQVFGISGSSAQSPTILLDWTLGEASITLHHTGSGTLSEGFQQVFVELKSPLVSPKNVSDILILPNPAASFVSVKFSQEIKENILWELFDLTGKSLQRNVFDASADHEIDISSYPDGMYILKMYGENVSHTHRITKTAF